MINKVSRNDMRKERHARIRTSLNGTSERPRLSVFRSNKHMYAQIIDDDKSVTLAYATTVGSKENGSKTELAAKIGSEIAAMRQNIYDAESPDAATATALPAPATATATPTPTWAASRSSGWSSPNA